MSEHSVEVESGDRFEFGKNWRAFLHGLNDQKIQTAEASLKKMLGVDSLMGKRFLDIGSGSGLFSLCARRLGATVYSFDYDPDSFWCTSELKKRYFDNDMQWTVDQASVLNKDYVAALGKFDIVYSWGVLHHTGQMWQAFENILPAIKQDGQLMIAIYNDQGGQSNRWKLIKKTYNRIPDFLKPLFAFLMMAPRELAIFLMRTLRGRPFEYFNNIKHYEQNSLRGMNYYHDIIDWVGGYPFEVAKPEEIFDYFHARGFSLEKLKTCAGGLGCNEFVFTKTR